MSVNIDTVFVQKFRSELAVLAEQKTSRLRDCAIVDPQVIGGSTWYDQIGHVEAQENTTRNGDTPITDVPFARRLIHIRDWDVHELIDRKDERKMLAGPVPKVVEILNAGMNRKMDKEFLIAAFGTAYTGVNGATTVAFPAANQIAVDDWDNGAGSGNSGLTISKLISAQEILDNNEVDGDDSMAERYIACTPKQRSNLLSTTEATSSDFAEIKALVHGEIDTFMGFKFKLLSSRIVPTNASGYRRVLAWQKAGMFIGLQEDITGDIGVRRDKRNSTQASCFASWGVARVEESRCVEIICSEV